MRSSLTKPDFLVLAPEGYLCAANAKSFQEELTQSISSTEHGGVVLNMGKVEFLDSAGLMSILCAYRLAKSLGKRFSLCSLTPSVNMVFELTQLDRALDIFEDFSTLESAYAAA